MALGTAQRGTHSPSTNAPALARQRAGSKADDLLDFAPACIALMLFAALVLRFGPGPYMVQSAYLFKQTAPV